MNYHQSYRECYYQYSDPPAKRFKTSSTEAANDQIANTSYLYSTATYAHLLQPPLPPDRYGTSSTGWISGYGNSQYYDYQKMEYQPQSNPIAEAVSNYAFGLKQNTPKPARKQPLRCEECNISVSCQDALTTHLAGARHARRLKELELNEFTNTFEENGIVRMTETELKCTLCGVQAGSLVQMKAHVDGGKHRKKKGQSLEAQNASTNNTSTKQTKNSAKRKNANRINFVPQTAPQPAQQVEEAAQGVPPLVQGNTQAQQIKQSAQQNLPFVHVPQSAQQVVPQQAVEQSALDVQQNLKSGEFSHRCHVCGITSNTQLQLDQHLKSKKHKNKIARHLLSDNTIRTLDNNFVLGGIL